MQKSFLILMKSVCLLREGKKAVLLPFQTFSDIFRYKLLAKEPGWWFDTDVFCLKSADDFDSLGEKSNGITVGYQSNSVINGAVIYIKQCSIAISLYEKARAKGLDIKWGDIGPTLITEYIEENKKHASILEKDIFYPIPFNWVERSNLIFDPSNAQSCIEKTKDAYCIHLWNEAINRKRIPKELYPPIGSYLHSLFTTVGESVTPSASISIDTINNLDAFFSIRKSEHKIINFYRNARKIPSILKAALKN
ncbi:glycosyltransferase [Aeromonas simiae]|uniref:Alpha 1,4-glycosyltransferase domain-containing protein n=1 Tax=Aeromonas simiae TaxID=218936 RepID=A0A5J6WZY3_9GAMM|nr:glycosyltransferase [Aeromonas simiae]QFI55647.1 hypothetical protein FE240_13670 [Aeromonas simiae]